MSNTKSGTDYHDTIPVFTLTEDIIFTFFSSICILFSIFLFLIVFRKKKQLRTEVKSYCVISMQILNLVSLSMLTYCIFHANGVNMLYNTTMECSLGQTDQTESCRDAK